MNKNSLKSKQFAALKKRLASGRPLTAAQMDFVERYDLASVKDTSADDSDTAASDSALARRLGVSRQLIAWHKSRAAAPETLSVSAWRDYLILHGKGGTLERVESSVKTRRDSWREIFGDGLLTGFGYGCDDIGDYLEAALDAAEVVTTPAQRDRITISLWLLSAARVHKVAMKHGCVDSPLTPVEYDPHAAPEDNDLFPSSIRAAATRINFDLDAARAAFYRDKPQ